MQPVRGRTGGDRGSVPDRRSRADRRLVDVTGSVEFGARVILEAFKHGKPVVLMNAEVDATIGPILQVYARSTGSSFRPATATSPACR